MHQSYTIKRDQLQYFSDKLNGLVPHFGNYPCLHSGRELDVKINRLPFLCLSAKYEATVIGSLP